MTLSSHATLLHADPVYDLASSPRPHRNPFRSRLGDQSGRCCSVLSGGSLLPEAAVAPVVAPQPSAKATTVRVACFRARCVRLRACAARCCYAVSVALASSSQTLNTATSLCCKCFVDSHSSLLLASWIVAWARAHSRGQANASRHVHWHPLARTRVRTRAPHERGRRHALEHAVARFHDPAATSARHASRAARTLCDTLASFWLVRACSARRRLRRASLGCG
eukprot:6198017-Pleurochrysis_carterae.AAC.2